VGATASLVCAPSIVRAASLMSIRRVIFPPSSVDMGFLDRLRLHLMDGALQTGWSAERHGQTFGGISETRARLTVADARAQGWLPSRQASRPPSPLCRTFTTASHAKGTCVAGAILTNFS
jgi:hypothetical protein